MTRALEAESHDTATDRPAPARTDERTTHRTTSSATRSWPASTRR